MLAYHNDPALKAALLAEVRRHEEADRIIAGSYGNFSDGKEFRGCAVGCSLHSLGLVRGHSLDTSDHMLFETEAGVPVILARLQDIIFEGLLPEDRREFPRRFWESINPGADLSTVGWKFLYWLLTQSGLGAYDHPLVRKAVKECADVLAPLTNGELVENSAAESAARSAASAARSAAWRKMADKLIELLNV